MNESQRHQPASTEASAPSEWRVGLYEELTLAWGNLWLAHNDADGCGECTNGVEDAHRAILAATLDGIDAYIETALGKLDSSSNEWRPNHRSWGERDLRRALAKARALIAEASRGAE